MKKFISVLLVAVMIVTLSACSAKKEETPSDTEVYKVGICNYVDDASLNQIIANIKAQLNKIADEKGVVIEIKEDNCNANQIVLEQIIDNFIADEVDLMVGVATPVAIAMQSKTEDNPIPVIFAAVSDPLACGLVESLDKPGANITGTSDYLNTNALMDLIFALDPDTSSVALLYDDGQDSSNTAIAEAVAYLNNKNIAYKAYNGINTIEIQTAVSSIIAEGQTVVFTPSDNTVMTAELSIYEELANAGVKHYAGADSFALNGAFVGYGVDYAYLGVSTGDMVAEVLLDGKNPSEMPVRTFDNGIATINSEITETLGLNMDELKTVFAPLCTEIKEIQTAASFE